VSNKEGGESLHIGSLNALLGSVMTLTETYIDPRGRSNAGKGWKGPLGKKKGKIVEKARGRKKKRKKFCQAPGSSQLHGKEGGTCNGRIFYRWVPKGKAVSLNK